MVDQSEVAREFGAAPVALLHAGEKQTPMYKFSDEGGNCGVCNVYIVCVCVCVCICVSGVWECGKVKVWVWV